MSVYIYVCVLNLATIQKTAPAIHKFLHNIRSAKFVRYHTFKWLFTDATSNAEFTQYGDNSIIMNVGKRKI
jgi:hypothetical protein